ncbi:hypothetical protein PAPYR_8366 [Paratrimastix pyriformis]|uniref:Uncharacterized protein n=1 Tax=Paratrimastix pyriformis TaxID=342808 RepID=A0ABQ8UAS0_9EUKA|nr:hypothetical protein PAPYR_8366 [Paratrimastix pyriformis]
MTSTFSSKQRFLENSSSILRSRLKAKEKKFFSDSEMDRLVQEESNAFEAYSIPLRGDSDTQFQPIYAGQGKPSQELTEAIIQEYAVRFLEKLQVPPTPEAIAQVVHKMRARIGDQNLRVMHRSKGFVEDAIQVIPSQPQCAYKEPATSHHLYSMICNIIAQEDDQEAQESAGVEPTVPGAGRRGSAAPPPGPRRPVGPRPQLGMYSYVRHGASDTSDGLRRLLQTMRSQRTVTRPASQHRAASSIGPGGAGGGLTAALLQIPVPVVEFDFVKGHFVFPYCTTEARRMFADLAKAREAYNRVSALYELLRLMVRVPAPTKEQVTFLQKAYVDCFPFSITHHRLSNGDIREARAELMSPNFSLSTLRLDSPLIKFEFLVCHPKNPDILVRLAAQFIYGAILRPYVVRRLTRVRRRLNRLQNATTRGLRTISERLGGGADVTRTGAEQGLLEVEEDPSSHSDPLADATTDDDEDDQAADTDLLDPGDVDGAGAGDGSGGDSHQGGEDGWDQDVVPEEPTGDGDDGVSTQTPLASTLRTAAGAGGGGGLADSPSLAKLLQGYGIQPSDRASTAHSHAPSRVTSLQDRSTLPTAVSSALNTTAREQGLPQILSIIPAHLQFERASYRFRDFFCRSIDIRHGCSPQITYTRLKLKVVHIQFESGFGFQNFLCSIGARACQDRLANEAAASLVQPEDAVTVDRMRMVYVRLLEVFRAVQMELVSDQEAASVFHLPFLLLGLRVLVDRILCDSCTALALGVCRVQSRDPAEFDRPEVCCRCGPIDGRE